MTMDNYFFGELWRHICFIIPLAQHCTPFNSSFETIHKNCPEVHVAYQNTFRMGFSLFFLWSTIESSTAQHSTQFDSFCVTCNSNGATDFYFSAATLGQYLVKVNICQSIQRVVRREEKIKINKNKVFYANFITLCVCRCVTIKTAHKYS